MKPTNTMNAKNQSMPIPPPSPLSSAAAALGRLKRGKTERKSKLKLATSRANAAKGGRPATVFTSATVTPARLRSVQSMCAAACDSLRAIARDAESGDITPAMAAKAANGALADILRAAR